MKKKILAFFVMTALLLSSMSTGFAKINDGLLGNSGKKSISLCSSITKDRRANGLSNKDNVRIIVELKNSPIIEHAIQRGIKVNQIDKNTYNTLKNKLVNEQEAVKASISKANIGIEYTNKFVNVFNGFSGTTTFENAKKIEKLSGVESVHIANTYERPRPNMDYSGDIIKAKETWNLNYKGNGMVVAIIDTGVDPNHKDMKLTNSEEAKLVEKDLLGKGLPGKFYTEKVPYGYNYMDNNNIILDLGPDASEHGMHVAGTVAANGEIKGIAPEAQLLAMKVFGNDPGMPSTFGDVIIKAIDDSIALGADVINMSLGATSTFVQPDDPEQMAVERAVNSGVLCSISAGNANNIANEYDSNPFVENPDYGLVGSPGLSADSLQVASIENNFVKSDALNCESGIIGYSKTGSYDPVNVFANTKVEYVDCGIGAVEDFNGKELSGKIALIIRGGLTFVEKIQNAQNAGAAGVIVYNHTTGGDEMINMMYPDDGKIPAMFVGNTDGKKLLALIEQGKNFVEFKGEQTAVKNSNAGKMSDFSSWGPTPNLDFKPEITAPGGKIYSTLQNNNYGMMSGTSMAAPHVSGGSALVLQRVEKDFNLEGKEKVEMAKNIIMSTANPVEDQGKYNSYLKLGNMVSPRKQGAGVMNLYAATTTPAIVTNAETGLSKVCLKEIGDTVQFTLRLTNFGDKELIYSLNGSVQTDLAIKGINLTEAQEVLNAPMTFTIDGKNVESITVAPNSHVDFNVMIDLTNATDWAYEAPLKEVFENGTFIEGFITLKDSTDENPTLNLPYLGFYGDWDKAPIFDKSVYDEDAMYAFYGVTALTWLDNTTYRFLGFPFDSEAPNTAYMAFSPNGDKLADTVRPIISFLRNAKAVEINILDKNGDIVRRLCTDSNIRKNYNYDSGEKPRYRSNDNWEWDGKVFGEIIEGQYTYQVKAKIDYPNAEWQTIEFPVKVDITAPTMKDVVFDKEKKTLTVNDAKDNITPIYKYEVVAKNGVILETSNNVIDLSAIEKLPYEVTVKAYDYALNYVESKPIILNTDPTIPYVFIETPEAWGSYNTSSINVKGYVTDQSGLTELKINGKTVNYEYNTKDDKYYFETTVNYADGVHKILVEGKDKAGNEIKFERKIFVDTTNPEVSVLSKPTRIVSRNTKTVKVNVSFSENSGNITVKVHGNEVFKNEVEWEYANEFTPIEKTMEIEVPLKYGENTIIITVDDGFGNKVEKVIGRVYRKLF